MKCHALFLFLVLGVTLICASGQIAPSNNSISSQSQIINSTDSGFRPDVNGFSFQNYGSNIPTLGLTPKEMQRMFGDKVVASKAGGEITLTPAANRWMIEANNAMVDGHCEGMAVLSELIYYDKVNPMSLGGENTADLSLDNQNLQKEIAYWWATQVTSPGGSIKVDESPDAVLDTLKKAFKDGSKAAEWWVMGLFMPDGTDGHTISPIAVKDFGNGTAEILVYDNNFPDVIRSVRVNTKDNTWMYYASVNPNEPSALYTGNASTRNLEVVSISSRLEKQRCDFCDNSLGGTGASPGEEYIQVWQDGNASLLITDALGRRIGYPELNKFVNEIPKAEVKYFKFKTAKKRNPLYILPASGNFKVKINGFGLTEDGFLSVMMIGPGSEMGAQRILLGPDDIDYMNVTRVGNQYQLEYKASRSMAPVLILGATSEDQSYEVETSGFNMDDGGSATASLDTTSGSFGFETSGNSDPGNFQVSANRIDESGEHVFSNGDTTLNPDDKVTMNIGQLNGEETNSVPIEVTNSNEGTTTSEDLTNDQAFGYSSTSDTSASTSQSDTPSTSSSSSNQQEAPADAGTQSNNNGVSDDLLGKIQIPSSIQLPRLPGQSPINA